MKKKLLAVFVLTYVTTLGLLTAVDSDIVKGFDFTGATSVTGAKLNQLVDNSYVGTNRGMIIYAVTNTAAAVAAESKLARYIWLDSSYTPPVPKVWDATSGYWTNITANATLTAGSVTTSILADGSVITTKIVDGNVTAGKLGGNSVTADKIMPGVITNGHIAEYTIQSTNIATNAIVSATIATAAVTGDKIAPGAIGTASLTNGFLLQGTNIANGTITSNNIASGGVVLSNLTVIGASTYSSLAYNGSSLAYDYPIVKYETNAAMPSVVNASYTNLAGAGTFTHSLGGVPHIVRVVLVNKANTGSGGYSVGDEIGIESLSGVGQRYFKALYAPYADATKVDLFWYREDTYSYISKGHTATIICDGAVLAADWDFKIIAIRFKY